LWIKRGALRPIIKAPLSSSIDYDEIPLVDAAAVLGDDGSLNILVMDRASENTIELSCDLRAFGNIRFKEHIVLHHDNVKAVNSEAEPNEVIPVVQHDLGSENGNFSILLPALSWNVLRFSENWILTDR
jgi:alpha-L-arabinofuranosidase